MKEVKISVPDEYEIDEKNSTYECIKFKPIVKRFIDDKDVFISGYIINNSIVRSTNVLPNIPLNHDVFASKKQAKSALAMARISQIIANDKRFGGTITDEEWMNNSPKYVWIRYDDRIQLDGWCNYYHFLAFHTRQQAELFLKENERLVRDYYMLD